MVLDIISREHNPDGKGKRKRKPLKWILADSVIIGLIALFASLPEHVPTAADCWVAFKTFGYALLLQLAVELGLRRK